MAQDTHHITGSNIKNRDPKLRPRTGRSQTHFTIILDLDATLICTIDSNEFNEFSSRTPDMVRKYIGSSNMYEFQLEDQLGSDTIYGIIRPYTREFLEFCDRYFERVIVYTAGTYDYGHAIVSSIFPYAPDYILTRSECLILDDPSVPIVGVRKPLELVIPDYDKTKCVLIDDRMSNIRINPRNGIIIPPFNPKTRTEALNDRALISLGNWFRQSKIVQLDDIRDAEKMLIFIDHGDLEKDFF